MSVFVGSSSTHQWRLVRRRAWFRCLSILCLIAWQAWPQTALGAEIDPQSDFRSAFAELPAMDLPCIAQSPTVQVRSTGNLDLASVRFARDQEGRAWLVISNGYPWSESFEIQWNGLLPEIVRSLGDSPHVVVEGQSTKVESKLPKPFSSRWRCDLQPYSHGGWELRASEATIVQWQHRAEPAAIAMLETKLAQLSQSLTQLTQFRPLVDTPQQGGFELSESKPSIPSDWLVSLNPSMSWQVSDEIARQGSQSLRFRSSQANSIGWIQSPPFALPDAGRVAAEAWIRFDPAFPRPKIVATTTLLKPDGSRQDWKQTYPQGLLSEKSSDWNRIDFPTLDSRSLTAEVDDDCRVRLALDIEGPTQLWIDDICASRIFLDEEERRKLRSQLFVAQRELSQNRPALAWQLTKAEVSRFILEQEIVGKPVSGTSGIAAFLDQPTRNGAGNSGTGATRKAEQLPFPRKLR